MAMLAVASSGHAADPSLPACGRRLASVAAREARGRARTIGRCVAEAIACPVAIDSAVTADTDACLRTAGTRCRLRLAGLARLRARAERVRGVCGARIGAEALLGDAGLAYERLGAFCRAEIPDAGAAFACQSTTLACTADATMGTLAPRVAELLARAGVTVHGRPNCFDAARCGNGEVDDEEECDDGPANSDTRANACRPTCVEAFCGDRVADDGEDCDDGNTLDGDGCDADCVAEEGTCGDGVVGDDEECDDGNRRDRDGCDADCVREPGVCGDGMLDDDEGCDEGSANSDTLPDRCRRDCTDHVCGDGVVDGAAGEACEPPNTLLCDVDCALRLSLPVRDGAAEQGLAGCERALVRTGLRVAGRARALVDRCVQAVGRCLLALREASPAVDRCLVRAKRLCAGAADRRDAGLARAIQATAGRCADVSLSQALRDAPAGLGFASAAGACPAEAETPTIVDLVACVLDRARCLGEREVAESVPRAHELLGEIEDDPEERFACVVDPDQLGSPGGAFVDGG